MSHGRSSRVRKGASSHKISCMIDTHQQALEEAESKFHRFNTIETKLKTFSKKQEVRDLTSRQYFDWSRHYRDLENDAQSTYQIIVNVFDRLIDKSNSQPGVCILKESQMPLNNGLISKDENNSSNQHSWSDTVVDINYVKELKIHLSKYMSDNSCNEIIIPITKNLKNSDTNQYDQNHISESQFVEKQKKELEKLINKMEKEYEVALNEYEETRHIITSLIQEEKKVRHNTTTLPQEILNKLTPLRTKCHDSELDSERFQVLENKLEEKFSTIKNNQGDDESNDVDKECSDSDVNEDSWSSRDSLVFMKHFRQWQRTKKLSQKQIVIKRISHEITHSKSPSDVLKYWRKIEIKALLKQKTRRIQQSYQQQIDKFIQWGLTEIEAFENRSFICSKKNILRTISDALHDERHHRLDIQRLLICNVEEMKSEQIKWDLQKSMTHDKIKQMKSRIEQSALKAEADFIKEKKSKELQTQSLREESQKYVDEVYRLERMYMNRPRYAISNCDFMA